MQQVTNSADITRNEEIFPPSSPNGRILIVDDQDINRQLLVEILEPRGYELLESDSGESALRIIGEQAPDLVLLDVTMSGMDGLEVCRRIRANAETAALPIIMVTALAHRQQQLDGIAAGASDYLTKPIDSANLLLRVRNAMHLRQLHSRVAAQLEQLQRLERARDTLVHMLVHDLRSPLQAITMRMELAADRARELNEVEMVEDIDGVIDSARMMNEMVSNVLDVNRFEEGVMPLQPARFRLGQVAREAIDVVASSSYVRLTDPAPDSAVATADPAIVRRVIANLVSNACKFSDEQMVEVFIDVNESHLRLSVRDGGPGIVPEHHARIFEKFRQVDELEATAGRSSGLGLTFCKLAVIASGGDLGVESELGRGATFWFTLPRAD